MMIGMDMRLLYFDDRPSGVWPPAGRPRPGWHACAM